MQGFCLFRFSKDIKAGLEALRSEIILLEIRQRSSAVAMDDVRTLTLINQLFFTIHHSRLGIVPAAPTGAFRLLLASLLAFHPRLPMSAYREKVGELAARAKSDEKHLQFLRLARILEYTIMGEFGTHDWKSELDPGNLCGYFRLPSPRSGSLPVFTLGGFLHVADLSLVDTPELPRSFFGFASPPYNFDVSGGDSLAICLLSGSLCYNLKHNSAPEDPRMTMHDTFTAVLVLRGAYASEILVWSYEFGQSHTMTPIYVDDYGDPDVGFGRGSLLHLSQEAADRLVDQLLSHQWTDAFV
jgi:hypothetical protein